RAMKRAVILLLFAAGCGSSANPGNDGGVGCTTVEGVCLFPPMNPAKRTPCGDVTEFCDKGATAAPNLACLASPKPNPSGPATGRVTGFIHVFSSGPDSKGVSVAFYDAAPLLAGMDIEAAAPLAMVANVQLDPATQRACDLDAHYGCSLPAA